MFDIIYQMINVGVVSSNIKKFAKESDSDCCSMRSGIILKSGALSLLKTWNTN